VRSTTGLVRWAVSVPLLAAWPALVFAGAVTASPDAPLSPADVLRLAASASAAAVEAAADSQAAAAAVRRAQAWWWPTVSAAGSYTVQDHAQEVAAGPLLFPMGEKEFGQYQVQAREILWAGGRRPAAVRAARHGLEATRQQGRFAVQQAQVGALQAYVQAVALGQRLRVLDRRLAALREHARVVQDLFEHGLVARNDLLEVQVRADQVADARAALADKRRVALADLNRRLGRDPAAPLAVPDSLPLPPAPADSLDALLAAAACDNAGLRAAVAAEAAAGEQVRVVDRGKWPVLLATATHAWQENDVLVYPHVNSVAVALSWDLFDGGVRRADLREARARLAAARRARLEAGRAALVALRDAWTDWTRARREEATARRNAAAAAENLRIVEDQYRHGAARGSDVLDAEALLAESRFQQVDKHNDAYMALARLGVAAGKDLCEMFGNHRDGSVTP